MTKKDFDTLPIAQQRVLIAQDLIARLDAKTFAAKKGTYLAVDIAKRDIDIDAELKALLRKTRKPCRGCQLGGMFVCAIDRHNALKLTDMAFTSVTLLKYHHRWVHGDDIRLYLTRWFSLQTLAEIEAAFEGWAYGHSSVFNYTSFAGQFTNPEDRMRLIAENIVRNRGAFKPKQILALAAAN